MSQENTQYLQQMGSKEQMRCELSTIAPLCACGCGQQVRMHRKKWNLFVKNHQMIGRKNILSQEDIEKRRARMITNNPMKNKETAKIVSEKTKGRPVIRSAEGMLNIANAARTRMLSSDNPMKNETTYLKTMTQILSRTALSKNEKHFVDWLIQNGIKLEFTGKGSL